MIDFFLKKFRASLAFMQTMKYICSTTKIQNKYIVCKMNYAIDIPRWISAKELAERAGVGRTTLYRFRNGDETVTEEIRAAITNTLEEMIEEKRLTAQTAA